MLDGLSRWRAASGGGSPDDLPDFAVEARPMPNGPRQVRPRLLHGSRLLAQAAEPDELAVAVRRIAASFAPVREGAEVRLSGLMPIVRDGRAVLVPLEHGGTLSRAWCRRHAVEPIVTLSAVVDVSRRTVRADAPLGGDDDRRFDLVEWWLPAPAGAQLHARGRAAEAVAAAVVVGHPVRPAIDSAELAGLVRLVEGLPPRRVDGAGGRGGSRPRAIAVERRAVVDRLTAALVTS